MLPANLCGQGIGGKEIKKGEEEKPEGQTAFRSADLKFTGFIQALKLQINFVTEVWGSVEKKRKKNKDVRCCASQPKGQP